VAQDEKLGEAKKASATPPVSIFQFAIFNLQFAILERKNP
jgi:hypothetical protein